MITLCRAVTFFAGLQKLIGFPSTHYLEACSDLSHNGLPVTEQLIGAHDSVHETHDGMPNKDIGDIRQHWGQYSPYFNSTNDIPTDTPAGCSITFVQLLNRHGARWPTANKTRKYAKLMKKLTKHVPNKAMVGKYKFLKDYKYNLKADDLTDIGEQELAETGRVTYWRYRSLLNDKKTSQPFVRASNLTRVVDSAEIFVKYLLKTQQQDGHKASGLKKRRDTLPILLITESNTSNNTLDVNTCACMNSYPYSEIGDGNKTAFGDIFVAPIAERLSQDLHLTGKRAKHALDASQTVDLMDICAFESVVKAGTYPPSPRTGGSGDGISPMCDMFSNSDFLIYDYFQSVSKWYGYGRGNPLAPTNGVGFVNELVARLTDSPVDDHTSTNSTLDSNPATFPLGKQPDGTIARFFADFSHDNNMMAIQSALGIWSETPQLIPTNEVLTESQMGGYRAASAVPFSARIYVEKMTCDSAGGSSNPQGELVRVLVNGRVVPLAGCRSDALGRCKLGDFVSSLSFARSGGDWGKCDTCSGCSHKQGGEQTTNLEL